MSQVGAITFGGVRRKNRGMGERRRSDCAAMLEEKIALSKYTDSLQGEVGEGEGNLHFISDSTQIPPHVSGFKQSI